MKQALLNLPEEFTEFPGASNEAPFPHEDFQRTRRKMELEELIITEKESLEYMRAAVTTRELVIARMEKTLSEL